MYTVTPKETAQLQVNSITTTAALDTIQPCVRRPGLMDIATAREGTNLEGPLARGTTTGDPAKTTANHPAKEDLTEAQAEALHTISIGHHIALAGSEEAPSHFHQVNHILLTA